ncbi:hypothetical protein [Ammoniphilus resinae]|uniref:Uncharacterized protein n=1 Tax=Ammoniphilus resinae TaxID=861532 RepID=A0ABS4GRK3_9BACL|nr:hypothetical protein [Ammoniphilus resinae]MBP1932906.1 hypothetical protein [Ammoniphilus resinae]
MWFVNVREELLLKPQRPVATPPSGTTVTSQIAVGQKCKSQKFAHPVHHRTQTTGEGETQ